MLPFPPPASLPGARAASVDQVDQVDLRRDTADYPPLDLPLLLERLRAERRTGRSSDAVVHAALTDGSVLTPPRSRLASAIAIGPRGDTARLLDFLRETRRAGGLTQQLDGLLSGRLGRDDAHALHLAVERGDAGILNAYLAFVMECREENWINEQQLVEHLRGCGPRTPAGEPGMPALHATVFKQTAMALPLFKAYLRSGCAPLIHPTDFHSLMTARFGASGLSAAAAALDSDGGENWLRNYYAQAAGAHRESMVLSPRGLFDLLVQLDRHGGLAAHRAFAAGREGPLRAYLEGIERAADSLDAEAVLTLLAARSGTGKTGLTAIDAARPACLRQVGDLFLDTVDRLVERGLITGEEARSLATCPVAEVRTGSPR